MAGRTWLMMALVLLINWGGFIALVAYGMRRESRPAPDGREAGDRSPPDFRN